MKKHNFQLKEVSFNTLRVFYIILSSMAFVSCSNKSIIEMSFHCLNKDQVVIKGMDTIPYIEMDLVVERNKEIKEKDEEECYRGYFIKDGISSNSYGSGGRPNYTTICLDKRRKIITRVISHHKIILELNKNFNDIRCES